MAKPTFPAPANPVDPSGPSLIERLIRRDRALVSAGLAAVCLLSWAYIIYLAQRMGGMADMAAASLTPAWGPVDFMLLFLMWAVMMAAMMTPSAAPMILAFAAVNRRRAASYRSNRAPNRAQSSSPGNSNDNGAPASGGSAMPPAQISGVPAIPTEAPTPATPRVPIVPVGVFLAGYLLIWSGFSLAAALAQGGLRSAALLSPGMDAAGPVLGALLLLTAGVFQWTPLKQACLRHCRTPLSFLTLDWREGYRGALTMGLRHGAYCLGCCWALMALLFVLGVMNLLWIAALSVFALVEKALPAGPCVGRIAGVGLLAWGVWLLAGVVLA